MRLAKVRLKTCAFDDTGCTSAQGKRVSLAKSRPYGDATAKRCHSPGTPLSS